MADLQAYRLFASFTMLYEISDLLISVAHRTYDLRISGKLNTDACSSYGKQLFAFMADITSISNRLSIVMKMTPEKISQVMQNARETGILAEINTTMMSALQSLKAQEDALSIAKAGLKQAKPREALVPLLEAEKLAELQQITKARYEGLFELCEGHLLQFLKTTMEGSPVKTIHVGDTSDLLCLAFHRSPFHVFSDQRSFRLFTPVLASLNSRASNVVNYPSIMRTTAKLWVDASMRELHTDPRNLLFFCERYLHLLSGLNILLDSRSSPPLISNNAVDPPSPTTASGFLWLPENILAYASYASKLVVGDSNNMEPPPPYLEVTEDREVRQQHDLIQGMYRLVAKEIERERSRTFSVALCGMVKSGKSLFLSAVLGRSILPSDELPSTAWPCRIRHVKGQNEPHLILCQPGRKPIFQEGLLLLRSKLDELMERDGSVTERNPERQHTWEHGLAPATKENWKIFKDPSFVLPNEAVGEKNVHDLLAQMNDVVRLCRSFGIKLAPERRSWPSISVEFESLRDESLDGNFEFYDLPGIGEFTEHYLGFHELIELVAREANVIIPIVSLKEVSRSDWRTELPRIIASATGTREPPLIICTHRDQVEERHLETQMERAAAAFCTPPGYDEGKPGKKPLCDSCSSPLGLGAQKLIKLSRHGKPNYSFITNKNLPEVIQDCVEYIIGNSRKRESLYMKFTDEEWMDELRGAVEESGLTEAMGQFSKSMARDAHLDALHRGIASISRYLGQLGSIQSETLLRLRRTREECEAARLKFHRIEYGIRNAQQIWGQQEDRLEIDAMTDLRKELDNLEIDCLAAAPELFKRAELELQTKCQHEYPMRDIYENGGGILKFRDENLSEELLGEVLRIVKAFLATRRGIVLVYLRQSVVNKEIKKQFEDLTTTITIRLGNEQSTLMNRLDRDMDDIKVSIQDMSLQQFARKAACKEIEENYLPWYEHCWPGGREKRSSYTVISREEAIKLIRDELIRPYLQAFRASAEPAFKRMMELGRDVAENAVTTLLAEERARYELEFSKKGKEPPPEEMASEIASHMNFVAAEAALKRMDNVLATIHEG